MCVTSVYGGRAEIHFHEAKHYYTVTVPGIVDRLFQPSVSSVLNMKDKSNALMPWAVASMVEQTVELLKTAPDPVSHGLLVKLLALAKDTYRAKSKSACDVGTAVHQVLEIRIKTGRVDLAPLSQLVVSQRDDAERAIDAGLRYFDAHKIEVIQSEAPRWSPTYGYIGTGDLIAHVDGELCVLDYKTSKAVYDEYYLQTAAYQAAYEEEFPDQKITRRQIIHVGRDGKLSTPFRDNTTLDADFKAFQALITVWRWDKENCGRFSKPAPQIIGPLTNPQETTCQSTL